MARGNSSASRLERGTQPRRNAIVARCTQYAPPRNDVHKIIQPTLKEQVSADIAEFPIKKIERITEASPDTIKSWRTGRRFPSWDYLRRLEPHFESVQKYIAHEFPHSMAAAHPDSPEGLALAFQQFLAMHRNGSVE